jgi:hypothetical protein
LRQIKRAGLVAAHLIFRKAGLGPRIHQMRLEFRKGRTMARYQVKLFKEILSSDGYPFHCLQSVTDVDADGAESAVSRVLKSVQGTARDWEIRVDSLDPEAAFKKPNPK